MKPKKKLHHVIGDSLCLCQGLDVDKVLPPLYPASGLVVRVEQDEALNKLWPSLPEPDEDISTEAGAETNKREDSEVMADVLDSLRELLHGGEGLLLRHGGGPRLLAWGVHVDHREVGEDEAHAGAVKQLFEVGDVIETEVMECDEDGRSAEIEALPCNFYSSVGGLNTNPLIFTIS